MKSFSQSNEQEIVMNYFGDVLGTFCDIGSNDGQVLSNTHALAVYKHWGGLCIEPSPKAFMKLSNLYHTRENISCMNVAIGSEIKEVEMWDSGSHLNKNDTSLLSTVNEKDYDKWKSATVFEKIKVEMITFEKMLELSPYKTFDFISIDAEGNDLQILRQMNLKELKCKVLCIEHNSDKEALAEIRRICDWYNLKNELLINSENIILSI